MTTASRPSDLFPQVFARVHRYWQRWDEGLWRYLELTATQRLLADRPELLKGPFLDLGCGDGEVFEWLFGRRPDAYGVDSGATRPEDLDVARESGRYAEVRREDAARLSFGNAMFGLVFSNSVVEHISPIAPVLTEVARVLRLGGHLVFTTPDPALYERDGYYWRRVLAPLGLDAMGRLVARRECLAYHHVSVLTTLEWSTLLAAAGLEVQETRRYVSRPAALAMSRFGGLTRLPIAHRFAALASPEARALSTGEDTATWTARCRAVLAPYLRAPEVGWAGGQLIVATKRVPQVPGR
jgi:SAM-dependent methyltransferase